MAKKKNELIPQGEVKIDEAALFQHVSAIIENRKRRAQAQVNYESVLMFWEVWKIYWFRFAWWRTCKVWQKNCCDAVTTIA